MSKHHHQRTHFRNFQLHFRPRAVPERTLRFTLTWGLGGMAMVLVLLLIGTGLLLKFVYEPFPDRAYDSILYLNSQVPFGQLLRNIHWWCANALILVASLHLLRVFYTGWRFCGAAPVELGDRPVTDGGGRFVKLHRLPATLGPGRFLGHHHQPKPCRNTKRP